MVVMNSQLPVKDFLSDGIIPSEEAMLADPQVYTIHDEPEL
jgi:hypothetical protein